MPKNTGANVSNKLQTNNIVVETIIALFKAMIPSISSTKKKYFEKGIPFHLDDPILTAGTTVLIVFGIFGYVLSLFWELTGVVVFAFACVYFVVAVLAHLVLWTVGRVYVFFA